LYVYQQQTFSVYVFWGQKVKGQGRKVSKSVTNLSAEEGPQNDHVGVRLHLG